jgi:hypothetical protein
MSHRKLSDISTDMPVLTHNRTAPKSKMDSETADRLLKYLDNMAGRTARSCHLHLPSFNLLSATTDAAY